MNSFVKQRDTMDCGPTCLAMVVKHYGLHPNRDLLRQLCDLGKGGVSMLGISKAAEEIGFKTVGGRLSFETLASEAPLPCIIHWNQNHFVVVYKVKKHRKRGYTVYVADPGKGLVTCTKEEFCGYWVSTKTNGEEKGIALLLEPTEQFYAQKETKIVSSQNRLKFLWGYLKNINVSSRNSFSDFCLVRSCNLFFPFLPSLLWIQGLEEKI